MGVKLPEIEFVFADINRCSYPGSITVTPIDTISLYPDPTVNLGKNGYTFPEP